MSILSDGSLADRLVSRLVAAGLPYALTVVRQQSDGEPRTQHGDRDPGG